MNFFLRIAESLKIVYINECAIKNSIFRLSHIALKLQNQYKQHILSWYRTLFAAYYCCKQFSKEEKIYRTDRCNKENNYFDRFIIPFVLFGFSTVATLVFFYNMLRVEKKLHKRYSTLNTIYNIYSHSSLASQMQIPII